MKAAFVAQDRADLGETARSLAKSMAAPTPSSMADLKRLGRYLSGHRRVVLTYEEQEMPKVLETYVDSDHATDRVTRKSVTGMAQMLGGHTIKNTSNTQTAIGLNVSECEFYALVHGGAHGLRVQSYMRDLGLEVQVRQQLR